ncbi:MAG TPA: MFS transporter [Gaiellaceae bacterium]
METVAAERSSEQFPIARNTALLSASLAAVSGMLQLGAAIATLTFVAVTGLDTLLGLGPAILLATGALAALPAGRLMDRVGRIPVLASGYVIGLAGCGLTALGAHADSTASLMAGLVCVGTANGVTFLTRTAAGDMYPPERRARGISLVLFGAVFGAILGPAVFSPLFSGKDVARDTLAVAWLAGGGFLIAGLVLVLLVRPDPKRIAERIGPVSTAPTVPAAPLREILRRPGVIPALLAALASFGVMVSVMNLTGYVVVHEHGHTQSAVFPIIGAHVLGMYALVLVVGSFIDRIGRTPCLAGGLAIMAACCAGLVWAESVPLTGFLLFGLGLGWNLSFVAATTQMVDLASPVERGKLLGFNDLCSGFLGAGLALVGGVALEDVGVAAMAIGAAAIALLPVLWITRRGRRDEPALASMIDR